MYVPTSDDPLPDLGDDKVIEQLQRAWMEPPSPDFLAHGCAERVLLVEGFGAGPNGVMQSLTAPIVKCLHFPAKALNNADPIGPLIAVDFVMVRVYRDERGVTVLGIATVGAVGRSGEREQRLKQGINELLAAEGEQVKRVMERHGGIFARAGIPPPVLTSAAKILELMEAALANGSAGSFDHKPARLH
jgi:hypothetical protein